MVRQLIATLQTGDEEFEVHHINAQFSETLEDIGETSVRKLLLMGRYLFQALKTRAELNDPILYYVPGPVKWSSVIRDWILLGVLRVFYRKVVFHWHAIGQGEWAHGSTRVGLSGIRWIETVARKLSAWSLERPFASIAVSETSDRDSKAISPLKSIVVPNGIEDPCPDYHEGVKAHREQRLKLLQHSADEPIRILFLSHGTEEKGLFDALEALGRLSEGGLEEKSYEVTFAGGVAEAEEKRFSAALARIEKKAEGKLRVKRLGYLGTEQKGECFRTHDIFLSPSRWESFGLTTLEAMAFGLIVVGVASDGVKGVLGPAYPFLSDAQDPQGLANHLRECAQGIRHRSLDSLGEALRKRFFDHFQQKHFECGVRKEFSKFREASTHGEDANRGRLEIDRRTELRVYLADQNPGYDRSFGISRMSKMIVERLAQTGRFRITTIVSETSQRMDKVADRVIILPWSTRNRFGRFVTDHFYPLLCARSEANVLNYFPKGYLPLTAWLVRPSVVTIHDAIVQYGQDHYPKWRHPWEYRYWAAVLKHTLRNADRVLTVSNSSREQIGNFMTRYRLPAKELVVTYEPCAYEEIPQPENPEKENYVMHLASVEPHKRTKQLISWWGRASDEGITLPPLHLIGSVTKETAEIIATCPNIKKLPFLSDEELQKTYQRARALILPSEIEGFGLPALEAYFLGTPVCFVRGTSVEEVLGVATSKGGMSLDREESLHLVLNEVLEMSDKEIREIALILRETYHSRAVVQKMVRAFDAEVRPGSF